MAEALPALFPADDSTMLHLAREIAADLRPIQDILDSFHVSGEEFEDLKNSPHFVKLLESQLAEWSSAGNTHERVKLKAAMIVEDWLPEAYKRLHDNTELLSQKTELGKLVAKLAGMGLERAETPGVGEKISVTINLGNDNKLEFERQAAPKVIDADPK